MRSWFILRHCMEQQTTQLYSCDRNYTDVSLLTAYTVKIMNSDAQLFLAYHGKDIKRPQVKYGVRSPKFLWAPCACRTVLIGWDPHNLPPPLCIWAHIRWRYWSAKIDDISLRPSGDYSFIYCTTLLEELNSKKHMPETWNASLLIAQCTYVSVWFLPRFSLFFQFTIKFFYCSNSRHSYCVFTFPTSSCW